MELVLSSPAVIAMAAVAIDSPLNIHGSRLRFLSISLIILRRCGTCDKLPKIHGVKRCARNIMQPGVRSAVDGAKLDE